jgi:hypothetical protein
MRNFRFWIPSVVGALLTPILFFAALDSTGAGHGSYAAALVLYPLSMLILISLAGVAPTDASGGQFLDTIYMLFVAGLAIIQFPFYGFVISYAKLKGSWWLTIVAGIIFLHLIGIAIFSLITGAMWAFS